MACKTKGKIAVDTLGVIITIALTLTLFFLVLSKVINDTWQEATLASAESVSKELAGYITISGAATGDIEINYNPSKTTYYNVVMKDRVVTVSISKSGELYQKTKGINPIAVDPIEQLDNAKSFVITKTRTKLLNQYINQYRVEVL